MSILIEFEGIDGAGKTAHAKNLMNYLAREGYETKMISSQNKPCTAAITDFLRAHTPLTIEQICTLSSLNDLSIQGQLDEPDVIILDRYIYTSIVAYRAFRNDRRWVDRLYQNFKKPDLVVLVDLSAQDALHRKLHKTNPFETGSPTIYRDSPFRGFLEFQTAMRVAYLDTARETKGFMIVDNSRSAEVVREEIASITVSALKTARARSHEYS